MSVIGLLAIAVEDPARTAAPHQPPVRYVTWRAGKTYRESSVIVLDMDMVDNS